MKVKTVLGSLAISLFALNSFAQKADIDELRKAAREARKESAISKVALAAASPVPADFNDTDSFGKNAKFLGSLYAGTVYISEDCSTMQLAPDDHCFQHNGSLSAATDVTVFDPVWQVTIPGRTVDNVIYPMLNNSVGYDVFNSSVSFPMQIVYSPRITIESSALNDPAAINPNTNLPMNGSFTTSFGGSRLKYMDYTAGQFFSDSDTYATVAGRGFSRVYFQSLGLPQSVISNLFKQPMTLKFGIRARVQGPVQFAQFAYSFRLLGN